MRVFFCLDCVAAPPARWGIVAKTATAVAQTRYDASMRQATGVVITALVVVVDASNSSAWWSIFGGGVSTDEAPHRNRTSHAAGATPWKAAEPHARAHASRDAILEEIAARRAVVKKKLDVKRRWQLGSGGAAEYVGAERASRTTRYAAGTPLTSNPNPPLDGGRW